ncbi:MAG TPA: hypothetical protein VHG93_23060, partial [Longimicrobium sp.]|nr:hypothetical protein [Longimicrobium sp.]
MDVKGPLAIQVDHADAGRGERHAAVGELGARFKGSPIKRAKRRGLPRNVAVVLGNRVSPQPVPALAIALNDEEPLVRGRAGGRWGASAGTRRGRRCGEGRRWRGMGGCGRKSRRR